MEGTGFNNYERREPPPSKQQGASKGFYLFIGVLLGIFLLISVTAVSCSACVAALSSAADSGEDLPFESLRLQYGDSDKYERVGVVEIKGAIFESRKILENLKSFAADERIKAIVVRIDSPGGSVGPSQEIYNEILKTKEQKKVVASMGAIAASGGFYVAVAADKIYANPGTITGSIGVISQFTYIKDLLNWMKMEPRVYKSGKFKDSGSGLREFTPEDDELFNSIIQNIYLQFLNDVASARKLEVEAVRPIADGRVLTGAQAKKAKLIDEYGNIFDAAQEALKLAGIEDKEPRLVYPKIRKEDFILQIFETIGRGAYNLIHSGAGNAAMTIYDNNLGIKME